MAPPFLLSPKNMLTFAISYNSFVSLVEENGESYII